MPSSAPYQVFQKSRHFPGENSKVEEASGKFVIVLRKVVIAKVLQSFAVLFLILHMS